MEPDFSRLANGADFYFVRHGESEGNRDNIIQGHQDAPLSERGRAQAESVGKWFAGRPVDSVFASPLQRAFETASIISRTGALPAPMADTTIKELDTGIFSGLSTTVIQERFPEEWVRFQSESWEGVPEAESVASLRVRAIEHWNSLIERALEGHRTTLSVTHGGMVQWLIKVTAGTASWMPLFSASNCGIFHFVVRPIPGKGISYFREWRLINHTVY